MKNLVSRMLATPCLVCRSVPALNSGICAACEEELPWQAPGCRFCGVELAATLHHETSCEPVCPRCSHQPPAFDRCQAVFAYEAPVSNIIRRFKDYAGFAEFRVLSDCLNNSFLHFYQDLAEPLPDLLLPVPLHPVRLRLRGFNQALMLARRLSRHTGIKVLRHSCRREYARKAQRGLNASQRLANMQCAFTANRHTALTRGHHLAIIDDVVTTTATTQAMATILRGSLARKIDVWALARSNHQPEL